MKKILSLLSFVLCLSSRSFSQILPNNQNYEQRAILETKEIKRFLNLDSITALKVLAINKNFNRRIDSIKTTTSNYNIKRSQIKKLNTGRSAELKKVLTNAQFSQYKQQKIEMRNRAAARRPGHSYPQNNDIDN
jgi:hypothetical protein